MEKVYKKKSKERENLQIYMSFELFNGGLKCLYHLLSDKFIIESLWGLKELSFCHNLKFSNFYISATSG